MRVVLAVVLFVLFVLSSGRRAAGCSASGWATARGVLVGTIGWAAGLTATAFVIGEKTRSGGHTIQVDGLEDALGTGALIVFFGVLAAMPLAIGVDLLTRSAAVRGRRGRWWLHPVRTVQTALAPYGRLREVIGHARHANLLHLRYATGAALDSPDLARRVRTVLEESGGMMVKLGQIASTRTDALPAPLTSELSDLRADVRPVPADDVRAVVEAGARRARRAGVRVLRVGAARGGVDRPDAPRGAARRRARRGQGPAARHRGRRHARRGGPAHDRAVGWSAGSRRRVPSACAG